MDDPELLRRTYRWELVRSCCYTPVHLACMGSGLVMVVAVQHFQAQDWLKGLLAAALHGGLLLAPLLVSLIAASGWRVTTGWSVQLLFGAVGFTVAGCSGDLPLFAVALLVCVPVVAASSPLTTDLWRQNAPDAVRGRYFSHVQCLGAVAGFLAMVATARWMGDDPSRFRPVFLVLAALLVVAAVVVARIPSRPLSRRGRNPLACLAWLWRDPLFGYISLAWMFIGLGNLASLPLRTEYVAAPEHLGYPTWRVLLLTTVLPQAATVVAILVWGALYDRMHFLLLRILINLAFAASILCFFTPSFPLQVVGALAFGVGVGGAGVAWHLWVTKYARPEHTAEYMAVHNFLTGARGLLGPQVAYLIMGGYGIHTVAWICTGLIVVSCLLLLPILRYGER